VEDIEKDRLFKVLNEIREWERSSSRHKEPTGFSKYLVQLAILKTLIEINEKLGS